MINTTLQYADSKNNQTTIMFYLKSDYKIWLPFALLSFLYAALWLNNYSFNLLNLLNSPAMYAGDYWMVAIFTEGLSEGWITSINRMGYPFGLNMSDFPMSDTGSFLILKFIRMITGSFYAAYNIHYLIGFPLAFVSAYLVSRAMSISASMAILIGILYTFLPYHLSRMAHLFLTYYFVVPFYCYYAYLVYKHKTLSHICKASKKNYLIFFAGLFILSSFGVYYAAFGTILILLASLASALAYKSFKNMFTGIIIALTMTFYVCINVSPSIYIILKDSPNLAVGKRSLNETEYYAAKISQMLLPTVHSKIPGFADISKQYYNNTKYHGEGWSSAFGLIGTIGFCILILMIPYAIFNPNISSHIQFLTFSNLFMTLFTIRGGFSSLFALFITTSLRAWNRVSVFLVFFSLLAFVYFFSYLIERFTRRTSSFVKHSIIVFLICCIVIFGLFDQYVPSNNNEYTKYSFQSDQKFISDIENIVPEGAAIYQLPYMVFPEGAPSNKIPSYYLSTGYLHSSNMMESYCLSTGYLHSRNLKWNFGAMNGREGGRFYNAMKNLPLDLQIDVLKQLGFSGIYVARTGYKDNGQEIEQNIQAVLKKEPDIVSDNNLLAFYMLNPERQAYDKPVTYKQLIHDFNDNKTLVKTQSLQPRTKTPVLYYSSIRNHSLIDQQPLLAILDENLQPIHTEKDFSIELLVNPDKIQTKAYAHIIGNHKNLKGFVIQQQNTYNNRFYFTFGNGRAWESEIPFTLNPDKVNYIAISVKQNKVSIYVDGTLVNEKQLSSHISQSSEYITIGYYPNFDRRFNGDIIEILIENQPISQDNVNMRWEKMSELINQNEDKK